MAAISEKMKQLAASIVSFIMNIIAKINGKAADDPDEDVSEN